MKRVVASAGIFAVGMAGLRGANVTGLTPQEQGKWWIVSGSLRGFYDDNSLNAPDAQALATLLEEMSARAGSSAHAPSDAPQAPVVGGERHSDFLNFSGRPNVAGQPANQNNITLDGGMRLFNGLHL